jgi:hypothetical protein
MATRKAAAKRTAASGENQNVTITVNDDVIETVFLTLETLCNGRRIQFSMPRAAWNVLTGADPSRPRIAFSFPDVDVEGVEKLAELTHEAANLLELEGASGPFPVTVAVEGSLE